MSAKRQAELITRTETHIGCWKQFNHFVNVARAKQFGPEDEFHFTELKKIIKQDREMNFASPEVQSPARQEIIALLDRAPSLRHLSEMGEGDLRGIENAWHTIYLGWHSFLGRIMIRQRYGDISFFGRKQ